MFICIAKSEKAIPSRFGPTLATLAAIQGKLLILQNPGRPYFFGINRKIHNKVNVADEYLLLGMET